ncbi:MAG TPA: NTP transferase domain-containing protein [Chloroflexota bacterium]|nr:NTP transferase domain-containing protein [Chloroflexota bacterium]
MRVEAPVAAILAGGAGSRMGRDKGLLTLPDGRTACATVVEAARGAAGRVVLLVDTEEHAARLLRALAPPLPEVLLDRDPGAGPLGSLAGALAAVDEPALVLLAVDMPLIRPVVLRALYARWHEVTQDAWGPAAGGTVGCIVAPVIGGMAQPMPACYDTRLAEAAARLLAAGRRDLRALLGAPEARLVPLSEGESAALDPGMGSFMGANTPDEWRAIRALHLRRDQKVGE